MPIRDERMYTPTTSIPVCVKAPVSGLRRSGKGERCTAAALQEKWANESNESQAHKRAVAVNIARPLHSTHTVTFCCALSFSPIFNAIGWAPDPMPGGISAVTWSIPETRIG